jgi:hypothetical protein
MRREGPQVEDRPDASEWGVDKATLARWPELAPGVEVTIVKQSAKHGGKERARYPATVVPSDLPAPWVALATHWTMGRHDQGLLVFENGDVLREIFSPVHPYDVFAVYDPSGKLKGWYGNVTRPAFFAPGGDGLTLVWYDLYVDIVAKPDGQVAIEDEDELAESGLAMSDPELHGRILAARDELLARFRARRPPFEALDRIEVDTDP